MAQEGTAVADASAAAAATAAAQAAATAAASASAPDAAAVAKAAADKAAAAAQTPEAKAAAEKAAADKAAADKAAAAAQTPEAKAAADKAAADKAAADKAAAEKAPEKYEDFKAPEGTVIDGKVATAFKEIAKELNLSQANAQKVIDKLAPLVAQSEAGRVQTTLQSTLNKARDGWVATAKADKEIGGDKFAENIATAGKAWAAFGTPELKKLLNDSGLGDHPEVIRWAFRVGSHLGPDNKFVGGNNATNGPRAPEDVLWPSKTS